MTRWSFLERANEEPEFPELPFRGHLTEWLFDVGPVMEIPGMGSVALSHLEIQSWAANIGLTFEGNEAQWLQKMSAVYSAELLASSGTGTSQPYRE